jgi:hypothetical protein
MMEQCYLIDWASGVQKVEWLLYLSALVMHTA